MFKKCEEACMDAKSKFVPKYGDSDVYICLQDQPLLGAINLRPNNV